jgi:hypothetical protein
MGADEEVTSLLSKESRLKKKFANISVSVAGGLSFSWSIKLVCEYQGAANFAFNFPVER